MVDIEDPITRKKLEELTLIPGVTRKRALYLYQSGIHSMEEFLQKAFRGERYSDNFSRTVANKLLLQSLRGKKEEQEILCPSCDAQNPADVKKCKVCNFEIEAEMAALDMGDISSDISESVTEMMDELGENEDFEALPDELKAQFASVLDSDDVDFEMEEPEDMEALGIDLDNMDETHNESSDTSSPSEQVPLDDEEAEEPEVETQPEPEKEDEEVPEEAPVEEPVEEEVAETPEVSEEVSEAPNASEEVSEVAETSEEEPEVETQPEPEKEETPEPKLSAKEKKIQKILSKKVDQWRKAGYDVDDLDQYYGDVETFKVKAKEVLEKGKVVRAKYEKQLEMWREKGFDVSGLEPLLNKDIDAFKDKAKDVLKQQKK